MKESKAFIERPKMTESFATHFLRQFQQKNNLPNQALHLTPRTDEESARFLYIKEIPLSKPIEIRAGLNLGLGKIVLSNAKKV